MSKIVRKIVSTPLAPRPVAPYNQAVVIDNTVYVSGCLGLDVKTSKLVEGGAPAEAKQALINLKNVLEAAGSSIKNVVKTTVLMNDINDFGAINEVYKQFFAEPFPSRTAFQAGKLPLTGNVRDLDYSSLPGKPSTTYLNLQRSHNFVNTCQGAMVEIEAVAVVGQIIDQAGPCKC